MHAVNAEEIPLLNMGLEECYGPREEPIYGPREESIDDEPLEIVNEPMCIKSGIPCCSGKFCPQKHRCTPDELLDWEPFGVEYPFTHPEMYDME